jgi:hypothetical protein
MQTRLDSGLRIVRGDATVCAMRVWINRGLLAIMALSLFGALLDACIGEPPPREPGSRLEAIRYVRDYREGQFICFAFEQYYDTRSDLTYVPCERVKQPFETNDGW